MLVGKPDWLRTEGVDLSAAGDEIERLQQRGLTVSGVARDGALVGLVGIGDEIKVAAATTRLVHPVFAMIAIVLSVTAVLANSFGGQLLAGENVTTDFTVDGENSAVGREESPTG